MCCAFKFHWPMLLRKCTFNKVQMFVFNHYYYYFCQRMFNVLWWYANVLDLIDFPYSFKGSANRLLRSTIVSNILDPIGFEVFLAHSSQFKCTLLWIMDRKTKVVSEKRIPNCLVQVPILLLACDWWNTLTMHFQRSTNVLQYVRFIRETYT